MNSRSFWRKQSGYTLVEVVITAALTLVVMSALTSVILTTVRAANTAAGRVGTSSQIRNFEYRAYDDFAHSRAPTAAGCGGASSPCTTSPIVLDGPRWNAALGSTTAVRITYLWDGTGFLDRQVAADEPIHLATDVKSFSWYLDGTTPNQTVVVALTVEVLGYKQSQTFRFYPRLNP